MSPTIPIDLSTGAEPGRPERSDAVANRLLLLETAEHLFAEHGVARVTMADIAKAAGVGKGTLYRRFAHKGELCLALMDTQMRTFQDTMLARMREMSAQEVPVLDQLAAFLEALVLFTEHHYPLLCEVQQHSDELDAGGVVRPHFWQYLTVHGLLQTAVRQGELPPETDTAFLAEALLAPLTTSVLHFQLTNLGFTVERISAGLQMLIDGLRGDFATSGRDSA